MTPKVRITAKALAKMIAFDLKRPGKESAGLLLGREQPDGTIYVEDIDVGEQEATAVHVQLTDDALVQIVSRVANRNDDISIIGWWHTHPGLRAFMSPTDVRTQQTYQAMFDKAIAIVLDPLKFEQTHRLEDLDVKVFQVQGENPIEIPFTVEKSLQPALEYLVFASASPSSHPNVAPTYYVSRPNPDDLVKLEQYVANMEGLESDKELLRGFIIGLRAIAESNDTIKADPSIARNLESVVSEIDQLNRLLREYHLRKTIATDNFYSGLWISVILVLGFIGAYLLSLVL